MRPRLTLVALPPESAADHVANAAQCIIAADAALERMNLVGNADGDAAALREAIRGAEALILKALFLLGASKEGGRP